MSSTTSTTAISPTFTDLNVKSTAVVGGTYIPPYASQATGSYYSEATATTTGNNPNPTTPAFLEDYDWINSYLTIHSMSNPSYRYAYILWLIVAVVVVMFGFLHLTGRRGGHLGARWAKWALRRRTWRKKSTLAAIRRSNKTHKQPWSLPSNAQILSLVLLFIVPAILCTIGPDYIAPGTAVWDLTHNLTRRHLPDPVDYDVDIDKLFELARRGMPIASTSTTRPPDFTVPKQWWTAGGRTGIIAFALFPLVILFSLKKPPFALLAIPYTIQIHFDKLARLHRWLGRLIWLICAVHVGTWSVQLYKDHRHGHPGRAWAFVWVYHKFIYGIIGFGALTLLTMLSVGPIRTRYYELFYISHLILVPTTLVFSALHYPPIWWWCWTPLFLWILERSYRMAHFLYLNGILSGGGSHAQKTVASFAYPEDETGTPLEKPSTASGYATVRPFEASTPVRRTAQQHQATDSWEMTTRTKSTDVSLPTATSRDEFGETGGYRNSAATDDSGTGEWSPGTAVDYRSSDSHAAYPPAPAPPSKPIQNFSRPTSTAHIPLPPPPGIRGSLASHLHFPAMHPLTSILAPPSASLSKLPPPGYAKAILLPGRTIRLSLITARRFTWSPGQHILLTIPSISRFTSHPFTIASVSDSAIAGAHGREMVLVIRAKKGFTKKLWEKVKKQTLEKRAAMDGARVDKTDGGYFVDAETGMQGSAGVTFRAWVDGPFGSSVRAHWGSHSSVVIICGGSGVSFGTAILEYLCLCLSGRDGRSLGGKSGGVGKDGFVTRRVRFVWIVREYSHLQWCAPIIRRCMDIMPNPNHLQVDIFVTNFNDVGGLGSSSSKYLSKSMDLASSAFLGGKSDIPDDPLAPPAPRFAREGKLERRMSVSSDDSDASQASSTNSIADLRYADGGKGGGPSSGASAQSHGDDQTDDYHVLDLTNFDDDDDTHAPGEAQLSLKLKKEGRLRRAASRKAQTAVQAKMELSQKVAQSDAVPGGPTARIVPQSSKYTSPTKSRNWDATDALLSPTSRGDLGLMQQQQASSYQDIRWGGGANTPTPRATTPRAVEDRWSNENPTNRMSRPDSYYQEHPGSPMSAAMDDTQTIGGSESIRHLMSVSGHAPHASESSTAGGGGALAMINVGDDVILEYDDDEMDDLHAVCEVARPGKPKLDRILKDEVERSKGAVAVACCGPTSLNCLTRKLVASLIDPERIKRGDLRGQISLTSEEFEW